MDATAQENKAQLNVISWNINGLKEKLKDNRKTQQLLEIFVKYDIVLLQETHLGKKTNTKKVAKATKLKEEKKLLEKELLPENEDEDGEEMKSKYEENTVNSEKQDEQNEDDIKDSDEDEDEEESKSEYEENTVNSEKQDEQNEDDIKDSDEDEDEEESKSEYEENTVNSEKQEEQNEDDITDSDEDEDEEESKSEYEENTVNSEKQEEQNEDDITDSDEDEDEEESKSEYEENTVNSEKQEEQNEDDITDSDEDEDEEESKSEYEENTVNSEKRDEQNEDDIKDSENEDEKKVINFFKKSGYVVEILQNQRCIIPERSDKNKIYLTKFCSKSRGVAILVNKQHKCLKAFCEGGDYAWIYVEIDDQKYTFVSAYYHPKEKSNLMLRILCSYLTQGSEAFQWPVIGGDFNTTLNYELCKGSAKDSTEHKSRRKRILEIMEIMKLKDVWREKHPNEKVYTFSCKKPMSRLDYVFMLQKHMHCVQNCDIWQDKDKFQKLSDHYPVKLTLTI